MNSAAGSESSQARWNELCGVAYGVTTGKSVGPFLFFRGLVKEIQIFFPVPKSSPV